jgi:hypothetical protein
LVLLSIKLLNSIYSFWVVYLQLISNNILILTVSFIQICCTVSTTRPILLIIIYNSASVVISGSSTAACNCSGSFFFKYFTYPTCFNYRFGSKFLSAFSILAFIFFSIYSNFSAVILSTFVYISVTGTLSGIPSFCITSNNCNLGPWIKNC